MIKNFDKYVREDHYLNEDGGLGSNAKPSEVKFDSQVQSGETFSVGKSDLNKSSSSYQSALSKIKLALSQVQKGKKLQISVTGGASAIPFKGVNATESDRLNKELANARANAFVTAAKADLGSLADKVDFLVQAPIIGTHTSGAEAQAEQNVKVSAKAPSGMTAAVDTTSVTKPTVDTKLVNQGTSSLKKVKIISEDLKTNYSLPLLSVTQINTILAKHGLVLSSKALTSKK